MSFTDPQFSTLLCVAETFVPALPADEISQISEYTSPEVAEETRACLSRSCLDDPHFAGALKSAISQRLSAAEVSSLAKVLDALGGGGALCYLLTSTTTPFPQLSRQQREAVLSSWSNAWLGMFRKVFVAFKLLVTVTHLSVSSTTRRVIQYPEISGIGASPLHTFNFLSPAPGEEIDADIVVVGSGAGGGVVAAKLAQAGHRVVVVEKGAYFSQERFPLTDIDAGKLYEGGTISGGRTTADGGINFMAGSTWGGGTTINWSASLRTPAGVRAEWAEKHGLAFMESLEFQKCLDRVCQRMGVTTGAIRHNTPNQILIEGAEKTGMSYKLAPQNTNGEEHNCGSCGFGCPSGGKKGGAVTWLVDAQKAGARCLVDCQAKRVLFEGSKAIGVFAKTKGGEEVRINAKKVVVSAGSLNTPVLLSKSGVENQNIGKNLLVHPCIVVFGFFRNRKTKPWEGSILTTHITEAENLDGAGYGARAMGMLVAPRYASVLPWMSANDWRKRTLRLDHSVAYVVLARDRDSSGTVTTSHDSENDVPVINYDLSAFDKRSLIEGIINVCKILVATGVDEIAPGISGLPIYKAPEAQPELGIAHPRFKEYVASLRGIDLQSAASAHQMGSCAMGVDPARSVVDESGKVWGYEGLYVADASVFPTASGCNPMITTMAMADWIAEKILRGSG